VNLLKKRDMNISLLLDLIKNGVKDKGFLEDRQNFVILSKDLETHGYQPGEIEYDLERNIYEMDIYDQQRSQVLLRVGKDILGTSDYKRMLRGYERIHPFNQPPFVIIAKSSEDKAKNEIRLEDLDRLFDYIISEAKKGINIQRYKGLGEMNADQLWETTMNPEKRNMLQVDVEDAEKADEIFTLLMGEEVEPRRNFIQKHALEVSSLDY